jgi:hypothetical protein
MPDFVLFYLNGQPITLWSLLIFCGIVGYWRPSIAASWCRSLFLLCGFYRPSVLSYTGLANIIIIALILGLVLSLVSRRWIITLPPENIAQPYL